jgi:tetratricopeptide (TPR) repeat protein
MLGVTQLALGRLDAAEEAFEDALRLQPLLAHVHINLGFVDQLRGDLPAALEHFGDAAHENPAFLRHDPLALVERNPYRPFYYETVLGYAGLAYHLAYCERRVLGETAYAAALPH